MNNSISSIRILPADIDTTPASNSGDGGGKFLDTLQQSIDQAEARRATRPRRWRNCLTAKAPICTAP